MFRVVSTGDTLADVNKAVVKDLRAANKVAGKQLGKIGTDAVNKQAPHMFGKQLRGAVTVETWPDRLEIEYHAAKGQAGAWQIQETGAVGHDIYPKRRRARGAKGRPTALELVGGDPGFYAANVWHPGMAGRREWTKAGERLARAIDREVGDLYDAAMGT